MRLIKRVLAGFAIFLVVAAAVIYVFRSPIRTTLEDLITTDMFVAEDNDTFDPGMQVKERFPAIQALFQGKEITQITQFIKSNGAIFIANRSIDW